MSCCGKFPILSTALPGREPWNLDIGNILKLIIILDKARIPDIIRTAKSPRRLGQVLVGDPRRPSDCRSRPSLRFFLSNPVSQRQSTQITTPHNIFHPKPVWRNGLVRQPTLQIQLGTSKLAIVTRAHTTKPWLAPRPRPNPS